MWTLTLPGSGLATLTYKGTCGASANCIINGTPPLDAKWNAGACPTTYATWLDLADKPWGTDADRIETDVCDWYWFYRLAPRNTPRNFLICISPRGGTRSPHRLAPTAKVATTAIADCREHVRVSPLSPKGLIQPGAPRFPGWIGAKNTHGSMSAKGCSALADSITCRRRVPSLFSPAAGNTGECVHFDFDEIPAELNSRGTFHREASGGAGIGDQRLDRVNCVSRAVSYLYKKVRRAHRTAYSGQEYLGSREPPPLPWCPALFSRCKTRLVYVVTCCVPVVQMPPKGFYAPTLPPRRAPFFP